MSVIDMNDIEKLLFDAKKYIRDAIEMADDARKIRLDDSFGIAARVNQIKFRLNGALECLGAIQKDENEDLQSKS